MPTTPPSLSTPLSEPVRIQLERCIDQLADMARQGIEPGRFFGEVLNRVILPGGATQGILWRPSAEATWEPVGEVPTASRLTPELISQRQALLNEVSVNEQPHFVSSPEGSTRVLCPIRHARATVGILETEHGLENAHSLPSETLQFYSALCEITGDFLARHELQQLRRARGIWQQWDQYSQRLWLSLDLPSVCAAIANDGRLLTGSDRISVLIRRGRRFQLHSVSGVDRIEPRSTATRSLEALAHSAARLGHSCWRDNDPRTSDHATPDYPSDAHVQELLQNHRNDTEATGIGVIPVLPRRNESRHPLPLAMIVLEQFHPCDDFPAWRSQCESLVNRSGLTLQAAVERSRIPWLGLSQWISHLLLSPATLLSLVILAGAVATLVYTPAEFTVTGPAQMWPAKRRELFASTSGIVDKIYVSHGTEVAKGQPLLELRDPVLETDTPRIIGEIATVQERIKGVQAARLAGGNTSDAVSRARQLTADEEELKERLRTLEQQRLLIEQRREELTLRSPIAGKVLTWDVEQHLSARPVERGQALLTIGETSGPWVVEVRVADQNAGHLLQARKTRKPDLDVDFLLPAEPGKVYHGQIQDVSLTAEIDDASQSHVRVVVAFDRNQLTEPRPGATALPRIRCGPRTLGYVWLHELIDAIRTRLLF
ncbi:MAG: HlyD family efflux transporter periplasmic adaptor subunit [Planctomycetota bacterium]|nr:MAG: HlyD family efflux transporter periplasmic adaptor subunit [Planctomycetota bacterium]